METLLLTTQQPKNSNISRKVRTFPPEKLLAGPFFNEQPSTTETGGYNFMDQLSGRILGLLEGWIIWRKVSVYPRPLAAGSETFSTNRSPDGVLSHVVNCRPLFLAFFFFWEKKVKYSSSPFLTCSFIQVLLIPLIYPLFMEQILTWPATRLVFQRHIFIFPKNATICRSKSANLNGDISLTVPGCGTLALPGRLFIFSIFWLIKIRTGRKKQWAGGGSNFTNHFRPLQVSEVFHDTAPLIRPLPRCSPHFR